MNIFVIGLGLIGGSMALDLKKANPEVIVYGIDNDADHLQEALGLKIIDHSAAFEDLEIADVVIVSVPVNIMVDLIPKVLSSINDEAIVFDVGSTKFNICEAIKEHPKRRNFLAAHPIAGTEFSGPKAAIEGLYQGKANIICEIEKTAPRLQQKALALFETMGMRIRYMDPHSHDKHIAYVSHLSHVSSFMLGKTVIEKEKDERDIFDMAGSGFASTVRLAKSSPAMWTPIFEQNKENVIEALDEYINNLITFRASLADDNYEAVFQEMEDTNHIKTILKGIS